MRDQDGEEERESWVMENRGRGKGRGGVLLRFALLSGLPGGVTCTSTVIYPRLARDLFG